MGDFFTSEGVFCTFLEVTSREDDESVMINVNNITLIRRSTNPKTKCDIYTNNGLVKTKSTYEEIRNILGFKDD